MESRFTFKDFVFVVLFFVVIGAVVWVGYQFHHQEERLTDVKKEVLELSNGRSRRSRRWEVFAGF